MPSIKSKEVEKILELAATLDKNRVSIEDFVEVAKILTTFAKESRDLTVRELASMRMLLENALADVRKANSSDVLDIKSVVEKRLNGALSAFEKVAKGMESEHTKGMNYLYDRVARLRDGDKGDAGDDGEDGEDGKDADPKVAASIAVSELWPKLEEELRKIREEMAERRLGGSGGTSAMGVQFALGKLTQAVTPVGDIDGVNTTYRVPSDIHAVFSFVINGEPITDDLYTVSGKTITMLSALPADLAGTSFRIVYV